MAPLTLDRRTFLTLAAAGLAAPTALLRAAPAAGVPSVGFIEGSDAWQDLDWPPADGDGGSPLYLEAGGGSDVLVASDLPLGDQDLAGRSVRIRFRGVYPEIFPLRGERILKADLDILWPSDDPLAPEPVPVFAWSLRRRPGASVSPPVTHTVPVGPDGRLDLRLRYLPSPLGAHELGVPLGAWQYQDLSFAIDWQEGQPKLQRGVYLVSLAPDRPWDEPRRLPGPGERVGAELRSAVLLVEAAPE